MRKGNEEHAPIQQSVHLDCPVEDAFRLFTERFAEWWPLSSHSVAGEDADSCEIEPWRGGKVLERTRSGEEHEWGDVLVWDPPERVEFTWHPGGRRDENQTVNIEFRVETQGTRVTLTHRGWQLAGAEICASLWATTLARCFAPFVCEQTLVAV